MTDEEPEPFRMPAEPDVDEPAADEPAPDEQPATAAAEDPAGAPAESIADLIDEAARTAAAQSQAEQRGELPQDRSADVWGEPVDVPVADADAVWQQAEDEAASDVWDLDEDDVGTWGMEVPAGTAVPEPPTDEPTPPPGPSAAAPAAAAAEGMPRDDDLEPETFTFAVDDVGGAPAADAVPGPARGADRADAAEEPETFSFPAGPDTVAPAGLPDHTDAPAQPGSGDVEPEAFSFAVADDEPGDVAAAPQDTGGNADGTETVEAWTVPGADAADDDIDVDTDVWTFDVTTDQDTPVQDAPLADAATPRDDAGWHDLEAEQEPAWEASDLAPQAHEDGTDGFSAAIQARADEDDDDAVWSAPALPDEEGVAPADVVTADAPAVRDALGDLLGTGDDDAVADPVAPDEPTASAAPAAAPAAWAPSSDDDTAASEAAADAGLDDFDHLDDLDDLEHLDDMAAAAVPEVGHDEAAVDEGDDDAEEDALDVEEPLDAPAAARRVMEPGTVTFSSGGKKKRGLFG